jgi:hypothetical protein
MMHHFNRYLHALAQFGKKPFAQFARLVAWRRHMHPMLVFYIL